VDQAILDASNNREKGRNVARVGTFFWPTLQFSPIPITSPMAVPIPIKINEMLVLCFSGKTQDFILAQRAHILRKNLNQGNTAK
jgi:hypothetical protein